jgi:multiple sugar transport system permease protein
MRPTHDFIGLENYITLITQDTLCSQAVRVTVHYVLLSVPLQLIFALLLAMMLNTGIPGLKYFRAAYYLPALMGGSVAVAILWRQVFGIEGIFNDLLRFVGAPESVYNTSWILNPNYAIYSLILLRVWQFGSPMIIFLAGLKQVPQELYESASLDGAGPVKRFFKITLPMISPIILFNLIMQMISAFQLFTSAFIIGGTAQGGGIANSLLFYTVYLFRVGFQHFQMGRASAMAWILVVIIGVFTLLIFRSSKSWVHYTD